MYDPRYSILTPSTIARFVADFESMLIFYSKNKFAEEPYPESSALADLYAAALAELDDMWEVLTGRARRDYAV